MKKTLFIIAALILSGLVWGALDTIHPFGEPGQVAMDNYFLEHAMADRSAENAVTSIVFDFRGFDTLGEAAVLFTAATSVLALFREGGKKK